MKPASKHFSLAELITTGPYRYTRNPQYGGDFAVLLGFAIFSNSLPAMMINLVGIFCFWMAPLAEEPWLPQQYGGEYEEYCLHPKITARSRTQSSGRLHTVPRFFGFRTKQTN